MLYVYMCMCVCNYTRVSRGGPSFTRYTIYNIYNCFVFIRQRLFFFSDYIYVRGLRLSLLFLSLPH